MQSEPAQRAKQYTICPKSKIGILSSMLQAERNFFSYKLS